VQGSPSDSAEGLAVGMLQRRWVAVADIVKGVIGFSLTRKQLR